MKSSHFKLFSILLISCLGIIVYLNTFHCSFHLDDGSSITDNFAIRNIHDLQSIWNFLPRRFILYLSLALNYHFNGLDVFGYHLFNLAVHLLTAILVWWLTILTLSTPALKEAKIASHANLIALLAGLVFVSHPLQTQAVTYIVQRAASMAALFYVASLCFYVQSRMIQNRGFARIYFASSLVTAVIAMFTKETAITLPLAIVLYEISFFKTNKNFNWGYTVPFLFMLFIIPITMLLTETGTAKWEHLRLEPGISCGHYLLTQFRVMVTYIRLVFFPYNQNLDYDYPISNSLFELPTLISFLFLMAVLVVAKRLFLKHRLVSFSIFWFFLTLLPESSFMPIKDVIFEHRLYLPLVGFSMFLVSGAYELFGKDKLMTMVIAVTIVITGNSVLTFQRNKIWKDEFTLWDDTVKKSPHKARAYNNRGNAYYKQKNIDQAMSDYNKAIELNPRYAEAYNNRGIDYTKFNNFNQALMDYTKAIELTPKGVNINNVANVYNNRGSSYDHQGNLGLAIADYSKAIEMNPNLVETYNNRGSAYDKQGNLTEAIADYTKAIEIDPTLLEAYSNRGNAYYKQNKITEALADYDKVIEFNAADQAVVYYNRGLCFEKQGNATQAMSDYTKAIKINPGYAKAYYNRGFIFDDQRNFTQAISDYTKAVEIDPKYAEAYDNRGNAYEHLGNFTQAVADFTKALAIDPDFALAYSNRGGAYGNLGDLTQAVADCTKAIEINPILAQAFSNRAGAYYLAKEFDKAMADVQKSERLGYAINPGLIKALSQALGSVQ